MGKLYKSKLSEQTELRNRMTTLSNMASTTAGQAPDGSYAKGILSGAASGALLGTEINAGWGTLIGGVVGAGVGAIGTAAAKNKEEVDAADETDLKENMKLQNKLLKQKYDTNQSQINWMTKLRNRFKYK